MAHVIKLKYGSPASWAYIDLTDSNHGNVDYYPGTPDEGAEEIIESGTWRVAGSSVTDLIAKIAEIEQVFHKAGAYDLDEIGAYQVWLTIQPDGVAATWQSQIFEGRLELTNDVFGVDWANKATEVVLIWRRGGFWECMSQLTISNTNGSGTTAKIYNSGDSSGSSPNKHENWVDIAAAQVTGDIPAAAVILLQPSVSIDQVLVLENAKSVPTATNLAEGETGSGDSTDANRSGGKFKIYTTPAGGTTGIDVSKVATGLDALLDGAWIRFIFSGKFSGTVYARPYIEIGGKRYYGPKSVLVGAGVNFYLYDLGLVRLPSASFSEYILIVGATLGLTVGINLIATTAIAVSVDYFQYIPIDTYIKGVLDISADSFVLLDTRLNKLTGNSIADGSVLTSIGTLYGGLYLEPNMAQRLTFKFTAGGLDTMANSATISVTAWLRKRTI